MFLFVNALCQCFRGVAGMDGNNGLYDYWAAIELFGNEMNTTTMLQITCVQGSLVRT
jgi:hypothetical protein